MATHLHNWLYIVSSSFLGSDCPANSAYKPAGVVSRQAGQWLGYSHPFIFEGDPELDAYLGGECFGGELPQGFVAAEISPGNGANCFMDGASLAVGKRLAYHKGVCAHGGRGKNVQQITILVLVNLLP